MSLLVRRQIPIVVVFLCALLPLADFFLKIPGTGPALKDLQSWGVILAGFALVFGAVNLSFLHGRHVLRRTRNQWPFSASLLLAMCLYSVVGVFLKPTSTQYQWLYNTIMFPLSATVYSSLAFALTSAIYRSMRGRNLETAILVIACVIVVVRNAPLLALVVPYATEANDWLSSMVSTSAMRGIMIGASLGAIALGIRTMLGMETGFLGRATEGE